MNEEKRRYLTSKRSFVRIRFKRLVAGSCKERTVTASFVFYSRVPAWEASMFPAPSPQLESFSDLPCPYAGTCCFNSPFRLLNFLRCPDGLHNVVRPLRHLLYKRIEKCLLDAAFAQIPQNCRACPVVDVVLSAADRRSPMGCTPGPRHNKRSCVPGLATGTIVCLMLFLHLVNDGGLVASPTVYFFGCAECLSDGTHRSFWNCKA
ncbi:hypothetical protein CPB85DRAFT_1311458 [Mucidula mucida]|nr:hypothetical protein CPB85DRAFT_1311458 [Mucidula mucida]